MLEENCNPEISIIVPVYNVENYLEKCIDSILNQTFKNFELILVDDGSTDRSGEICEKYKDNDSRVRVFHNINKGVSFSRNFGINKAIGNYLMFCDSDDFVSETWIEELYKYILLYPNSWINCNIYRMDYDTKEVSIIDNYLDNLAIIDISEYYKTIRLGISGSVCNKIFNKKIINKFRIYFNDSISYGEDVEFTIDYLKYTDKIIIINKPLYYYVRYKEDTLSKKYFENKLDLLKHIYIIRKPFIDYKYMNEFSNEYFYLFSSTLNDNVKNKKGKNLLKSIIYNQNLINSKEFQECLEYTSYCKEDFKFKKLLRSKNYYIVYMYQQISSLIKYLLNKILIYERE